MEEKISFEEIIKKGKGAVVVDVHTKEEYKKEHLKGSLNVPRRI